MPVILVTGVYFVAVTLTGYTGDHLESFDDRYQAPLYYFILLLLFVSLDELVFSHLRGRALTAALALVVAVFAVWGAYRLDLLVSFARASRGQGVVPYNTYNTQKLLRSGLVTFLQQHPFPPGAAIYTNETEALYTLLHGSRRWRRTTTRITTPIPPACGRTILPGPPRARLTWSGSSLTSSATTSARGI